MKTDMKRGLKRLMVVGIVVVMMGIGGVGYGEEEVEEVRKRDVIDEFITYAMHLSYFSIKEREGVQNVIVDLRDMLDEKGKLLEGYGFEYHDLMINLKKKYLMFMDGELEGGDRVIFHQEKAQYMDSKKTVTPEAVLKLVETRNRIFSKYENTARARDLLVEYMGFVMEVDEAVEELPETVAKGIKELIFKAELEEYNQFVKDNEAVIEMFSEIAKDEFTVVEEDYEVCREVRGKRHCVTATGIVKEFKSFGELIGYVEGKVGS